jgi:dihydrofolate reductase
MKIRKDIDRQKKTGMISIVVALGDGRLHNHVIGAGNGLLWHIPEDLKRFKALTLGHAVIMGRKTFESIASLLGKALPGRTNIVVTRDPDWNYEGTIVAHSFEDALAEAKKIESEEIFIGGGSQIYAQALPLVGRLYLTLIEDDKTGDSFFPEYEKEFTKVISQESREWKGLKYRWVTLER